MLVLTRKEGEKIKIGEMVTLTVVRIVGTDKVRIGIEAPDDVPIDRLEIAEAKKRGFVDSSKSFNRLNQSNRRHDVHALRR
jgi:carbon storage regulator